ncbi:MAG: galactose mutarotase [Eubacterium sp.]|nr:galactose mutarotase [Eubacterium sp.]
MKMEETVFGTCPDGTQARLFTLTNQNGMSISVSDLGAALVKVLVPDGSGSVADVVLGFDRAEDYLHNPSFFGVVIGPSANRIGGASFEIEGQSFQVDVNDGTNNLHSHKEKGYHKRIWTAAAEENSVTFTLRDEGSMGFPGKKEVSVRYTLTEDNELKLHYHGTSDRKTILNLTNHTYFNLDGHDSGRMEEHELWLGASRYTPVVQGAIPTGEIADVKGTPMDFTTPKKVGRDIGEPFEQLELVGGYDHNWVIDGWDGSLRHIATVRAPGSGRVMKAYTTLPGVQFYAGNFIEEQQGKGGAVYGARMGLCLEMQYFPDAVHHADFPSCVFGAGKDYDSETVYRFEWNEDFLSQ